MSIVDKRFISTDSFGRNRKRQKEFYLDLFCITQCRVLVDISYDYRDSDVFVMPSFTETFGLVYVEAMSQGLPVVYSSGQGFDGYYPEGHVGYSVIPSRIQEIAAAIVCAYSRKEEMRNNCLESAKVFSWSGVSERYVELYCSIQSEN